MDNFYQQCPAVMDDSRIFTDYSTSTRREQFIKYINNIQDEHEYRFFLQNHATTFMGNVWDKLKKENQCFVNECIHNHDSRVNPAIFAGERELYNSLLTNSRTPSPERCEKFKDYNLMN